MNHELIERYIYAVTRRLPVKLRGDVEKELASLISDMLEARCGAVTPEEKDIRIVLTELGSPEELAAKYSGDEGRALIGGSYFLMYKFVLKLVLPIAAGGIAFASILALLLGGGPETHAFADIATAVLQPVAGAIGGCIQAFAIITIIFAIFEWKKVKFSGGDFLAALPTVPIKNERIKPWEPIAGMVWCVVAAVVFLGFPQVAAIGSFPSDGGDWVPLFNVPAIRALWLPVVLWAVLGIAKEIVKLVDGRYTRRLAIVTLAADIGIGGSAAVTFSQGRILNPAFLQTAAAMFDEPIITGIFAHFNLFFLGVVLFALALEMGTVSFKAWKYGVER